jgi:hypothetical protein
MLNSFNSIYGEIEQWSFLFPVRIRQSICQRKKPEMFLELAIYNNHIYRKIEIL